MAQEGAIVQITLGGILIYIYIYEIKSCQVFFKCHISVKARDRKNKFP